MPKLQYRFNDTTKDILLYDTPPNDKYIAVQLDGKTYYAGLLPAGHTRASNLRICRAGQEAYAIAKEGGEKAHLEDYSWSEIAAIIKAGNVAEYFSVGDTRPITFDSDIIDSGVVTYRAQILGIDHNAEIEGYNRVHFAIGRDENDTKDICLYGRCMNTKKTHATVGGIASNEGGWEGSDLRSWLNDTFYNALPVDLRTVITPCTKIHGQRGAWLENRGSSYCHFR
ncbi:MAG: hypothetical protein IKE46_11855 [Selenomonadaceae bacterium]|nr:hypothetical protein [Selenomonadaceae bacterium]